MERTLANKTVTFTELRDPAKVLKHAGSSPVAVLNRNKVVGYFVPKEAVDEVSLETASLDKVAKALHARKQKDRDILKYLEDK